jgi:nucleoside-diphosphate-sugar epimerase
MRILVTGAAGFVGSNLVTSLLSEGNTVNCLDALLESTYSAETKIKRWESLSKLDGASMHKLDLRHGALDPALEGVDAVIHSAAIPGLSLSWENFELYSSCNLSGTEKLVKAILRNERNIPLIQISTSSVYGAIATGDENSILRPVSPYGVTKLAAEKIVEAYASNFDLRYSILRYFSIYGPGQRTDMAYSKFIYAIANDLPITVFGSGLQTRTNTFISDCVDATTQIAKREHRNEIYNLSGVEKVNVLQVISILEEIFKKKAILQHAPGRPGDQFETEGNIDKLREEIQYHPKIGIREGLQLQVEEFLSGI